MCDPAGSVTWEYELAAALYARIGRDAVLRPLFPGKSHRCAIEAFAAFLVQFFGGPGEDTQKRWFVSLEESHSRFRIREEHRERWMQCMTLALADARIAEPFRSRLQELFQHSSGYVVNSGPAPAPAALSDAEMATRWERQLAIDRAVTAIRTGDLRTALYLTGQLGAPGNLLALMVRGRNPELRLYVMAKLTTEPARIHDRSFDRTLLQEACAQGDAELVEFLLDLGADANQKGNRPPLYTLANEYEGSGGSAVVRLLVARGAEINRADNVKRCTALHMAARRGNVEIATALLDSGANINARDSSGDTPLQRAINCRKRDVAALLVKRGVHHL